MGAASSIIAAIAAVVGAGSSIQQGTQTKKAQKSAKDASIRSANEKLLADKEAKVSEQTSIATGQEFATDASNALKAMGAETQAAPGSTIGAGTAKKTVIGA